MGDETNVGSEAQGGESNRPKAVHGRGGEDAAWLTWTTGALVRVYAAKRAHASDPHGEAARGPHRAHPPAARGRGARAWLPPPHAADPHPPPDMEAPKRTARTNRASSSACSRGVSARRTARRSCFSSLRRHAEANKQPYPGQTGRSRAATGGAVSPGVHPTPPSPGQQARLPTDTAKADGA